MEELKRPNCAPEKKQVVMNIGKISTHGGGGFGGLILLGGALATAAFASAFIIGKKRRGGSGHIPPPPAAVNDEDKRNIEANKKEEFTFLDAYKHSSETTREIELKNDSQSLMLYEKDRIEINGVDVCDSEASEQTLCYVTPRIPENNAISNGGVSHLPVWEQKTLLPVEIENEMVHEVKIQSSREAAIDEHGITKECKGFEEMKAEGESRDDGAIESGEIHEVKCEDTEESKGNYVPEIGLKCSQEGTFVSGLHGKDGQESISPAFGNPISKHENVNGDEKHGLLSDGMVEIVHDYQTIEGAKDQVEHIEEHLVKEREQCDELDEEIIARECEEENDDQQSGVNTDGMVEIVHDYQAIEGAKDRVEHIEEHLVKECEQCDELDEEIIARECEEENDDQQSGVNKEEKGYIDNSAPGNRQPGDSDEDVQICKGEKENDDQQNEVNDEEKGYNDNSTPENRQLGDSGEDVQILAMHLPEEEQIFPEEMEVSEDDAVNEEIEVSFCQIEDTEDEVEKNIENEVEDSSETIDTVIASAKDEEYIVDGTDGDEDLSDEAEQNTKATVDSSMESNSEGVWPAEAIQEPSIETQQLKLVNQEIEGKIEEDTIVKRGKHELHPYKIIADRNQITNGKCNSAKRYVMDLATLKDYSTNSGIRRVLLVAIPVLSSVSCSWFFGLSFDKLCFVILLTIVLSKSLIVI